MGAMPEAQAGRVIISGERQELVVQRPRTTAATLLAIVGGAFAVVGIVDLALAWYPLGFGSASWEFGTLSRTFDNVPMSGLGVVLVAAGMLWHPAVRPSWIRAAAIFFGCVVLVLLALAVVYTTAAPAVLRDAPPEVLGAFKRALVKNGVQIVVYSVAFGGIGALLWRSVTIERKPPSSATEGKTERREQ